MSANIITALVTDIISVKKFMRGKYLITLDDSNKPMEVFGPKKLSISSGDKAALIISKDENGADQIRGYYNITQDIIYTQKKQATVFMVLGIVMLVVLLPFIFFLFAERNTIHLGLISGIIGLVALLLYSSVFQDDARILEEIQAHFTPPLPPTNIPNNKAEKQEETIYGLLKKGGILLEAGKTDDALAFFSDIKQRFAGNKITTFAQRAENLVVFAQDLDTKANTLIQQDKFDEANILAQKASDLRKKAIAICKDAKAIKEQDEQESYKKQQRKTKLTIGFSVGFVITIIAITLGLKIYNTHVANEIARIIKEGESLVQKGELNQASSLFDENKERFDDENTFDIAYAKALIAKGEALELYKKDEDAIKVFHYVIQRFGKDDATQEYVAKAAAKIADQGIALIQQNKTTEAIIAFDKIIAKFEGKWTYVENKEISEQIARALFNKGVIQDKQGKFEETLHTYSKIADSCKVVDSEEIKKFTASAIKEILRNSAQTMDEETSIFIDKLAQTGNSIIVSSAIITAFLYRAEILIQKGKTKEAIAIYDTMKNHPTGFTELHGVIVRKMNLMRKKDKNIDEEYFSKDHERFLIEADRFLEKGKSGFKGAFANISLYLENKLSDDSSRDMINNMLGIDPYRSSYRESGIRDAREFSRAIKSLFANDDDPEIKKMFEETDSADNTGNNLLE